MGNPSWGCKDADGQASPFYAHLNRARVLSRTQTSGSIVELNVTQANITACFTHLSATINVLPMDDNTTTGEYSNATDISDAVQRQMVKFKTAIEPTWDLNTTYLFKYGVNFDYTTKEAKRQSIDIARGPMGSITCDNCYAYLASTFYLQMDIETSYGFPYLAALDMGVNSSAVLSSYTRMNLAQPLPFRGDPVALTDELYLGNVILYIVGIPISINTYSSLSSKVDILQNTLQMEYFAGFKATADLSMGVRYQEASGFQYYNSASFVMLRSPPSIYTAQTGTLDMRFYSMPKLRLNLYGLADISIIPKPYLGFKLYKTSEPVSGDDGISSAQLNAAKLPNKPVAPIIQDVDGKSIQIGITPPPSSLPINKYQVRFWCSDCYTYTSWQYPTDLGFFTKYPGYKIVPSRVIMSLSNTSTNATCAGRCLAYTKCSRFAYSPSKRYCELYNDPLDHGGDYYMQDASYALYEMDSRKLYRITKGDLLAYKDPHNNLTASDLDTEYAYQFQVRALNAKGWGEWSESSDDSPYYSPAPDYEELYQIRAPQAPKNIGIWGRKASISTDDGPMPDTIVDQHGITRPTDSNPPETFPILVSYGNMERSKVFDRLTAYVAKSISSDWDIMPNSTRLDYGNTSVSSLRDFTCPYRDPLYFKWYWGLLLGLEGGMMSTSIPAPDISIFSPRLLSGPFCYDVPVRDNFIDVVSPMAGANWGLGTDFHEIRWTYFGNRGSLVRITLHDGVNGQYVREITGGVAIEDQAYLWEINPGLAKGRYIIVLLTVLSNGLASTSGLTSPFNLVGFADDPEASIYFSPLTTTLDHTQFFDKTFYKFDSGASFALDKSKTFCAVSFFMGWADSICNQRL